MGTQYLPTDLPSFTNDNEIIKIFILNKKVDLQKKIKFNLKKRSYILQKTELKYITR